MVLASLVSSAITSTSDGPASISENHTHPNKHIQGDTSQSTLHFHIES
jgi:hypothetical protein